LDKKVLVIGSNSFSGSTYIKYLLARDYVVYGCSRSEEKINCFLPYTWVSNHNFTFLRYDLNKDINSIVDLIFSEKISYVVNFAAQSMVGESWDSPGDWFQTNAVALSNLISGLKEFKFIKKYVHVTTPEVYGSCEGFISEQHPINPSTPYASSRVASDLIIKNYFDAFQFPFVATRAANVFGPGQQLYRIIPKTILSILLNKKIPLHGGGASTRSFIFMDDVCEATEILMQRGKNGETYHISTSEIISIKELVQKICIKLNTDYKDVVEDISERTGKDATYQLSSQKLKQSFGWDTKTSLDEGLDITINWVKNNFDELKKTNMAYIHKK